MCNSQPSASCLLIYFLVVLFICLLVVSAVLFLRFASGRNSLFFKTRPH